MEYNEGINKTPVKFSSQFILQENHFSKIPASFDKNFEHISPSSRIEATKFEPEPKFEMNIDKIKYDRMKIITSLDMKLSDIDSNQTSLSSEHLNTNFMTWIVLQSPGKSPQSTKTFSSMHLTGNTQLQIRKWWVSLRP